MFLPDLNLFSDLVDNRIQNIGRVYVGRNAHLDFGEQPLQLCDHLNTRLYLLRLDFIFPLVIAGFERVDLLHKAGQTIVDLEEHASKARVSHILDADGRIFFADPFLDGRYNWLRRRVGRLVIFSLLRITSLGIDLYF